MTDIATLLERVQKATGPDREIDAALYIAVVKPGWHISEKQPGAVAANKQAFAIDGKLRYITSTSHKAPPYTASVDAALELVERVLPGCGIVIDREPPAKGGAAAGAAVNGWIGKEGPEGRAWEHFDATGATFPLAILAALLSALEAAS